MKTKVLLLSLCLVALSAMASTVNYTADNSTIFPNPERGFITMIGGTLSESKPYGVKGQESSLENHANNDKGSLVLVHYYLTNYRTSETIPTKVLNAFDEDMGVLRSKKMKAIIRFSYTNGTYKKNGVESGKDASLEIVQKHIAQYKSHWQANADVIFCFQAGIVGAWGEWYYTDNFGNMQGTINDARRALIDTLLAAVPADRMIQLRTPLFKTGYIGDTKALTEEEAFTGTPRARLGQHNDAFLYDYDNMGTYTDTAKQKPWLAQETLYVPIGGETDITDVSLAQQWATYDKTIAEMSRLHWTFIQSGYAEATTNMWRNNGTFDELNRRMGYRFQLVKGTYGDQVEQGGKLSINMQIRNAGFAPLYNERPAYIVLKNSSHTYKLRLASDPRTWKPNGVTTTINEQVKVPSSVATGTYQLYLYLPDAYSSIADKPAYAVRFANSSVWESSTGMNKLNAQVTVVEGSGTVDPIDPGDAIQLPATLNKANVDSYSNDMTWYNSNYFDFGPDDAPNLDRWAQWNVYLKYPGEYIVSEVMATYTSPEWGALLHSWKLQLLNGNDTVSTYTTPSTREEGNLTHEPLWDLSSVPTGVYTLKVMNVTEWAEPKLKSLTLDYNGELPDPASIENVFIPLDLEAPMYDLLGRPVGKGYHGIVIQNGNKYMVW